MTVPADRTKLNWAFSTLGCPEASLEEACALARKYNIAGLEVRALSGRTDIPDFLAEKYGEPARVREILDGAGVKIVGFGTSFKMVGSGPADRAALLGFAPWADALGVPYLRAFGGGKWGEELTEAHIAEAVESVNWWREQRTANGWKTELLMETHDAFSGAAQCQRLFDALDDPIDIIWDTHHTWKLAGENPADSWAALQPRVRHIHVKDSIGQPSGRHPYTYVLPGEGEMPLQDTLGMLAATGYRGAVSLEWEKQWHPYLAPLDEALQSGRNLGWF